MKTQKTKIARVKSSRARSSSRRVRGFRVAVIGVGRLGTALARALEKAGYQIELVVARRASSAARAASLLGDRPASTTMRQLSKDGSEALLRANLVLICTPDDEIAKAAQQLAELLSDRSASAGSRIALHASGALSSTVLRPLKKIGFATGSLHPLVSIANTTSPGSIFSGVHFSVEGDRAATQAGRSIVKALRGRSFSINPAMKPLYHAAAVMASGNVVALYDVAIGMIERCGLSTHEARQALWSLLSSTVENLKTNSPAQALTGPFARGDVNTAKKHLDSLAAKNFSGTTTIYLALAQHALKMSKATKSSATESAAIAKLLKQFQQTRAR